MLLFLQQKGHILRSNYRYRKETDSHGSLVYKNHGQYQLFEAMYLIRTPRVIQNLFPGLIWNVTPVEKQKQVFITFDDGPVPEITPWVLDTLNKYNAKATFFAVGDNVRKHPDIFQQVIDQGHAVGNHTFNHLSGWATDNIPYFHNVRHCARIVDSQLFRPPYGRLKRKQVQFLSRHYTIIMWDILSGDFDPTLTPDQCYANVIDHVQPGSIIVFHDSLKAEENMRETLPKVLRTLQQQGYSFEALSQDGLSAKRELVRKAS